MQNFIPYEKLSKKARRERNAKQRGTWGALNPVTRKPENLKAYNRKKVRKWSDDSMTVPFIMPVAVSILSSAPRLLRSLTVTQEITEEAG